MTWWPYVAGTGLDYSGVIEFPSGLRLGTDDGTFRALIIPPLLQSAPLRLVQAALPGHGSYVSDPKLDGWQFDVAGRFIVDTSAQIQAAIDYLRSKVNRQLGWQTVTIQGDGWADPRQMTLRVAGQVSVDPRERGDMVTPSRDFTIPLVAIDPRQYETTETVTTITTATAVTNNGEEDAPFKVRFNSPVTDPRIDLAGTSGSQRIRYAGEIASGYVEVNTYDPTTGTLTAVDSSGNNVLANITATTAKTLPPGASSWTKTVTSGAGAVEIRHRGAWA